MVNLDIYVLDGMFKDFKDKLFKGFAYSPRDVVKIMKAAFGDDYHISIFYHEYLNLMLEKAIKEFLEEKKIVKVSEYKGADGKKSAFMTTYKKL